MGRKHIEKMKRLETLSNVIPVPSPDDEEGDKFWKKVIDDFKRKRGRSIYIYGMICFAFVGFGIIRNVWNLTEKKVIVD